MVNLYSNIKMMHGPVRIRFTIHVLHLIHIRALMTLFYVKIRLMRYMCQCHFIHTMHCYMLRPSGNHPQGVLIHFVSRINKIHIQIQKSN